MKADDIKVNDTVHIEAKVLHVGKDGKVVLELPNESKYKPTIQCDAAICNKIGGPDKAEAAVPKTLDEAAKAGFNS